MILTLLTQNSVVLLAVLGGTAVAVMVFMSSTHWDTFITRAFIDWVSVRVRVRARVRARVRVRVKGWDRHRVRRAFID